MQLPERLQYIFMPRCIYWNWSQTLKGRLRRLARLVPFNWHRRPAASRPASSPDEHSATHSMTCPDDDRCFPLPNSVLISMDKILAYLWDDEFDSYWACSPKQRIGHIFDEICIVRHWIWTFDEPVCHRCPEIVRAYPSGQGPISRAGTLKNWLKTFFCQKTVDKQSHLMHHGAHEKTGDTISHFSPLPVADQDITVLAICRHFRAYRS